MKKSTKVLMTVGFISIIMGILIYVAPTSISAVTFSTLVLS